MLLLELQLLVCPRPQCTLLPLPLLERSMRCIAQLGLALLISLKEDAVQLHGPAVRIIHIATALERALCTTRLGLLLQHGVQSQPFA